MKRFGKLAVVVLIIAALAVGAAALLVSRTDIGSDIVLSQAKKIVLDTTGATLEIETLSGNPVGGFTASGVTLSMDGNVLASAQQATVKLKLMSLLSGNPGLKSISFGGAEIDWERLSPLFPEGGEKEEFSLPLDQFELVRSVLRTPAGIFRVEEGTLSASDGWFVVKGDLLFREMHAKGSATFSRDKGALVIENLDVRIAGGRIRLKGDIKPQLDVTGEISDIDIATLTALWPELEKQGIEGALSTSITAGGDWKSPRISGDFRLSKGRLYGIEISQAASPWTFEGRSISMPELTAQANGTPLTGAITISASSLPARTSLSLSARNVDLAAWRSSFPWLSLAEGSLDSLTLKLEGSGQKLSGPVRISSSRLMIAKQPLSALSGTFNLKNGSSVTMAMSARWLDSPVSGQGNITLGQTPTFDFTLSGEGFDLKKASEIIPVGKVGLEGDGAGTVRIFGKGQSVQSEGKIWSQKIRAVGELVTKPAVSFAYKKGTLTIRSLEADWRGTSIKGSGTIDRLQTDTPRINLSGTTGQTKASALAGFVPAMAEYGLTGSFAADWSIRGPASGPTLGLNIKSSKLAAKELTFTDLGASTSIKLPPTGAEAEMKLNLKAGSARWNDYALSSLETDISLSRGLLTITKASAKIWNGAVSVKGTVKLPSTPKEKPSVDLSGNVSGVDMAGLSVKAPFQMAGKTDFAFTAKGHLPNPAITFSATSPELVIAGLSLKNISASGSGAPSKIVIETLKASAGKGSLTAKGSFGAEKGKPWADFSLDGSELDLSYLTKGVKGARSAGLGGIFDASVAGGFRNGKWNGSGEIFASRLSAWGLSVTDFYAPVIFAGSSIRAEKGNGKFYGGTLTADASIEIPSGKWKVKSTLAGVNVDPVVKNALDLKGSITGTADMNLELFSTIGKPMLLKGHGDLVAIDGAVSGFKIIKAVAAIHKMDSLRYKMIDAAFNIDGRIITLLPGSRATAYPDDPLYRHFGADGSMGPGDKINLFCNGYVNVQALNALFGAVQGMLGSGSANPQMLLEGLIGGFVGGMSNQDFRDISFRLRGSWDKPSISDVKISSPQNTGTTPQATTDPGQTQQDNQNKVKISVPTGEGATGSGDNLEDQLKQQILEQVIKQAIPDNN